MGQDTMAILEKRRAQAEVVKCIYDTLTQEFGKEKAQELIGESIKKAAIEEGHRFAELEAGPINLRSYAQLLPLWTKGDALTLEMLTENDERLDFNVTRCRYAEMYREMGLEEFGHLLSCNRDGSFCEGYNPRIELTRSQTIMRGAPFCDFRYRLVEAEKD